MEKVLSQQEIDSLITAISAGEVEKDELLKSEEKRRARKYDFRRPNKFSKEHVNAIKSIYENFARTVTSTLSNSLRANVDFSLADFEQISYGELMRSVPNSTLMAVFSMEPFKGMMLLEVSQMFGFRVVDLLCGGTLHKDVDLRGFTEIEISILKDVMASIIEKNKDAWEDILDLNPALEGIVVNPQLNLIFPYEEAMALITFDVKINEEKNVMSLCIPYLALGDHVDKLHSNQYNTAGKMTNQFRYRSEIEQTINKGQVNMSVLLGKTEITVGDFMDLRCGDVLQLDILAGDPMKLYVEDCEHLYVQPGIYKDKLAVQVVDYAGKDVD